MNAREQQSRSSDYSNTEANNLLATLLANTVVSQLHEHDTNPLVTTGQTGGTYNTNALLKQYEKLWHEVSNFDASYIQITLLYIALIGAYIGVVDKPIGNPFFVSMGLGLVGTCIIGIIIRLRALVDSRIRMIYRIESITSMISIDVNKQKGVAKIRTSVYLEIIVAIMTILAILLTLFK
jgi:hypothetical protein